MLTINFIRALAILAAVGLFHIYTMEFLSVDEGAVIFLIAFIGITLTEIVLDRVIDMFNQKSPRI